MNNFNKYFVNNNQIVVLYEYIDGDPVNKVSNLFTLGEQFGYMRKLMESYVGNIINHGYDFFIKRYLDIMKTKEYQGINKFTEKDVVRHELVQRIIKAYEKFDEAQEQKK